MEKKINQLEFVPLYYKEKLKIINPIANIGIITLWSDPEWVIKKLEEENIDLNISSSKIAVIGTLYGNGLPYLIRNLLYNPQIITLFVCGRNRSGSLYELISYFKNDMEEILGYYSYTYKDKEIPTYKIKNSNRIIDGLIPLKEFDNIPRIIYLEELKSKFNLNTLQGMMNNYIFFDSSKLIRKEIPVPNIKVNEVSCNPFSFSISKRDVVSAWEELIFVLNRFGKITHLKKGDRKELQNIKVVIEEPESKIDERLYSYWFDKNKIEEYKKDILKSDVLEGSSYSYGNRIRSYFGIDCLDIISHKLNEDLESRDCYISLWDTKNDIITEKSSPCLVSIFFRYFNNKLNLTATFRVHNVIDAWIYNYYGLKTILDYVCDKCKSKLIPGTITIISHSVSIDMNELIRADKVSKERTSTIILDPRGNFEISIDPIKKEIIVKHITKEGLLIKEYKSNKALSLHHQLYSDMTISDISHAMYIGRQLARAEIFLNCGITNYIQE